VNEFDERGKGIGSNESDLVVRITHATKHWDDEEDDIRKDLDVQQLDDICRASGSAAVRRRRGGGTYVIQARSLLDGC
jgi:hypothetical protein